MTDIITSVQLENSFTESAYLEAETMTDLKDKLKHHKLVKGMHTTLSDCSISELCGMVGFDFLWIDTEHAPIDYYTLLTHIIAAHSAGTNSLIRVPWNDPILAKRVIEMGPDGIIFPVVNTAEELDAAMQSTLYPPKGKRGFGPVRAIKYGLQDVDAYVEDVNRKMIRCVQIESAQAVSNLKEMAKNPYVDCFIFGACDLSGSIGELNKVFAPHTQGLIKEAISILKDAGKSIGISTGSDDPEVIRAWHELGINFISAGTDYLHVLSGAQKVFGILDSLE
jgi:2-dehydro-3-deoxyglucarate aldolase/4-hydroxy-2-oxoheptanedioate aldolase